MNKGLLAYLKMGLQTSKQVIKGRKVSIFKYYFLVLSTLLSYLFILPAPAFVQANIRMNKQNAEKQTYELTKVFVDTDNPRAYWTCLMAVVIKVVLFLSGIILIGGLCGVLFYVGSLLAAATSIGLLRVIFVVPGIIGLFAYIIGFNIVFAPLFYYLNNDNSLNITKAFNASVRTMKEQGKKTMFLLDFIHLLINGGYIGLAFIISSALMNGSPSIKVIGYLLIIVFTFVYIFIAPRLGMTHRIAKLNLLNDIMIDPNLAENPSLVKEKMIKQGLSKDEFLVNLFDKKQEAALEEDQEEQQEDKK